MLDHVGLDASDYEVSKAFDLQALAPLGIAPVMEFTEWKSLGLGDGQKPYLDPRAGCAVDVHARRDGRDPADA